VNLSETFSLMHKINIIIDEEETGKRRVYGSRIEDLGEKSLTIAAPYSQGYFLQPRTGVEYKASISASDCSYVFKTILLKYIQQPIPLWEISLPTVLQRQQVRSFVRLDVILDIRLEVITAGNPVIITRTKDISAGGLRILLDKPISVGTKLNFFLTLSENDYVEAAGEVVRVILPEEEHDRYEVAIRYSDIKERIRSRIVKYIFKKQIERRRKENDYFEE